MRNWYEIDDLRNSWSILTVQFENEPIQLVEWELADANITEFSQTQSHSIEDESESVLCERLGEALASRRQSSRLLITNHEETLGNLRQTLLSCNRIENPTLRGFRHVCLSDVLSEYFGNASTDSVVGGVHRSRWPDSEDPKGPESVESLWNLWAAMVPLLPATVVHGREL